MPHRTERTGLIEHNQKKKVEYSINIMRNCLIGICKSNMRVNVHKNNRLHNKQAYGLRSNISVNHKINPENIVRSKKICDANMLSNHNGKSNLKIMQNSLKKAIKSKKNKPRYIHF
jgi:hypothetical protein